MTTTPPAGTERGGRVAVVTGGASGIGRRTAELFVAQGMSVVVGDRDEAAAQAVAARLGEQRCVAVGLDVTDEAGVERLVATAVDRFGRLDAAVNAAGFGWLGGLVDHDVARFRAVVDTCLVGVMLSVKHEARAMTDGGAIVNISSLSGRQPTEGMAAYCAAKAGVDMLTRVAALELGPRGVRVNAIAPGFIETPLTAPTRGSLRAAYLDGIAVGRSGQPEDVAQAALFLVSDAASFVTGECLAVDGGASSREAPRMLTRS